MEEVIIILQQWADYRKTHPQSEFEDFCRFYLAKPTIKSFKPPKSDKQGPQDLDGLFWMTVSRTTLAFWVYMRIALKETPMPSIESLMLCAALNNLGESRKTDVINYAMLEISTGTDIINRLVEKGFINQRVDAGDKRSKLLTLSDTGRKALYQCYKQSMIARDIMLTDLTDEDKKLVAQILNPIQEKHSKLSVQSKGKTIKEIYASVTGKKPKG